MIQRLLVASAALVFLAAAPGRAAEAPPAPSAADVVSKLVAMPPWLQELESVVGPLHRDLANWDEAVGPLRRDLAQGPVEHVDLRFSIDFYHQDPQREENVKLASWNLLFRGGAEDAISRLRQRFGEGQSLDFAVGRPRRFGDFYFTSLPAGRFELAWYGEEPEWAVPQRSAAEERALEDQLTAFLRSGIDNTTLRKSFGELSPNPSRSTIGAQGPQWRLEVSPDAAGEPTWISIEIRGLPLDVSRLIGSLGLSEPGLIATDVHLSGPELSDLRSRKRPIIDGYKLNVRIDHDLLESVPSRPSTAAWKPTAWRVRGLWLSRARDS